MTASNAHFLRPARRVTSVRICGLALAIGLLASTSAVNAATPDQAGGDPVEATMRLQVAFADLVKAIADPLARCKAEPGKPVTGNEVRRADYYAQEVHAAIGHVLGTLRGHARPAPVGV